MYHIAILSFLCIGTPANVVSRVTVRRMCITGLAQRMISSTADALSPSRSACHRRFSSGNCVNAHMPWLMAVRVVSLPAAMSRRKNGPRSSGGIASPSTSACTSVVVRSSSGCSRRFLPSQSPYSRSSALACKSDSRVPPKSLSPPASTRLVRSSSFARSPSGTPIMSQMMATGSASATSVTNSASPFGAMASTIRRARSRTASSAFAIILGVKPRFTTLRSFVCFGGSVAIIDRVAPRNRASSGSIIAWIP